MWAKAVRYLISIADNTGGIKVRKKNTKPGNAKKKGKKIEIRINLYIIKMIYRLMKNHKMEFKKTL